MKHFVRIVLLLFILLIPALLSGCSNTGDSEREDIINFMNNKQNLDTFDQAFKIEDDWNNLPITLRPLTTDQARTYVAELELRASNAYRKMAEIVPPVCLRSVCDKWVESSKLFYQAISLTYQSIEDDSIKLQDINGLVFKGNDLKTQAQREFEDICRAYNVELPPN